MHLARWTSPDTVYFIEFPQFLKACHSYRMCPNVVIHIVAYVSKCGQTALTQTQTLCSYTYFDCSTGKVHFFILSQSPYQHRNGE